MMSGIQWDDTLSIGVERIDEQHKALIQRLAAMARAVKELEGEREILRTLAFLIDYTRHHFSDEEELMQRAGYPGLEVQKTEHGAFKQMLDRMEEDLEEEGATKALAESIDNFLMNWLTQHIRQIDAPLGRFLTEASGAE